MSLENLSISGSFFIRLLADRLNHKFSEPVCGIDWDELLEYASIHKVEGMIYLQSRAFIPKAKQALFGFKALQQFKDSQTKAAAVIEIEKAFTEAGIGFMIVKGPEVAAFYRELKERAMGDIDIVVRTADKSRAAETLKALGYQNKSLSFFDWKYQLGDVMIELHDHLLYEAVSDAIRYQYTETMWEHAVSKPGSSRKILDWNFHLMFLILHLNKHFETGGVGFRLFIDLVEVIRRKDIDIDLLEGDLRSLGLFEFASRCFALCERWFGVSMPFAAELTDAFYNEATEKILNDGVFGSDEEFMDNYVHAKVSDTGRFNALRNRYFPPVKYLKNDPRFACLEKYPILLPYAWCRRYLYGISEGKLKKESSRLTRFFASGSKMSDRNRYLSDWGVKHEDP